MNITKFSDYTLRVLIYLAVTEEKASASEIASAYGISFHHVAKAAQWLRREGYVLAERGRGGGMSLSQPPMKINIGEVLQRSEADTFLVECFNLNKNGCRISPVCGLRSALADAETAFYEKLKEKTLADISPKTKYSNAFLV